MLNRKLWRDLWQNRTQFLSIFLMAFLGLLVFVGMDAESHGARISSDKYYEETNLADYWLKGRKFSEDDVKKITSISGVIQAERQLNTEGKVVFPTKHIDGTKQSEAKEPYMILNFMDTQNISKMQIIKGKEYVPDKEGIWIEEQFATQNHLSIGDAIDIKVNNVTFAEEIKGIIRAPEYVYYVSEGQEMMPPYGSFGYAYLSGKEYPEQLNGSIYTTMLVDVDVTQNQEVIKEKIRIAMDDDNLVVSDRSQNLSFDTFDAEVKQHQVMGFMFPIIFLLIAILGMVTTMTRMTMNQRIQIGTLKALGFHKSRITLHYISFGFWISLLGSVLGAIAGFYGLPPLIQSSMRQMYILPKWEIAITTNSYIAVITDIAISTLVSFLACRRELREPAAVTLKPKPPKKIKHSALEKSKLWLRMNFQTQWNIRDILRNKARTAMGVIGVAGCTMLLVCAFGCVDSIGYMPVWLYEKVNLSKHIIVMEQGTSQKDTEEYARKYKGQMIEEQSIEISSDAKLTSSGSNLLKTGVLTVVDKGNYMHFTDETLQETQLEEKGIMITYKMAELLGVKVGDYIRWHIIGDDTWQSTRIAKIDRIPSGQGIIMSKSQYEALDYEFQANKIFTNLTLPKDIVDDNEVQTVQHIDQMKEEMIQSLEMMNMMVTILVIAATILGVVVLYNLGVLSFVEKTREIATLKVLGFRSKKIRGILQMQNIWVTTAGIILGIPIGYLFLIVLCGTMSDSSDLYPMITIPSYCYAIIGTFAVSILVNSMLSGKVKTIDMVDALKGVE